MDNLSLNNILKDAASFKRIGDEALLRLFNDCDSDGIAETADYINAKINSGEVSYVVNRNINFTNICGLSCKFCGYRRTKKSKDAFLLSYDEITEKISEGKRLIGIDEICVTGGINPDLKPDFYFELIRNIRSNFPGLHIHAFSPQEVYELSKAAGLPYISIISMLAEAGVDSMPGTAAEILAEDTRKKICPGKIDTGTWIEIIKTAHSYGMKTSATILFGHIESNLDLVKHLSIIRNIQDETGGFTEFIALPFIPFKTPLGKGNGYPGSFSRDRVLKFYAILRLYLDNFKNIQTSWPKIGITEALKSLRFGVNDFGGTLMEENITKSAGGNFGEYLSENEIIALIRDSGKIPIRRDTLYNRLNACV